LMLHRWMQVWHLKQVQHLLQPINGINIVEKKQNQLKIIETFRNMLNIFIRMLSTVDVRIHH
jgi:hypothetical protein